MWTRTYAQVPDSYSEPAGLMAYTFIGWAPYQFVITNSTVTRSGRPPYSKIVPVRLQRDYFLVGIGGSYATAELIPKTAQQIYTFPDIVSGYPVPSQFIWDSPPFPSATTPSLTAYQDIITAVGEIVVENSTVTRWMGNIFCRETRYVLAQ